MHKNMSRRGTVLMVAVIAAWVGGWVPPAVAKNAFVEVTGQTTPFAEGDDGDIPRQACRFPVRASETRAMAR